MESDFCNNAVPFGGFRTPDGALTANWMLSKLRIFKNQFGQERFEAFPIRTWPELLSI